MALSFNITLGWAAMSKELSLTKEEVADIVTVVEANTTKYTVETQETEEYCKLIGKAPANTTVTEASTVFAALGVTQELLEIGKAALDDHHTASYNLEEKVRKTTLLRRVWKITSVEGLPISFTEKLYKEDLLDVSNSKRMGFAHLALSNYLNKVAPKLEIASVRDPSKKGEAGLFYSREKKTFDAKAWKAAADKVRNPKKRSSKAS